MFTQIRVRTQLTLIIILLGLSSVVFGQEEKSKKKKAMPKGMPVLWQAPRDISSRDLYLGPGGAGMKPDLRRVRFIEEEEGGYSVKYRVRDGSGREWVAKVGKESQSETAAVRLLWAAGYQTEINYLYPCVHIRGAVPKPRKDVERCEGDGFSNVRFEARPKNVKRLDEWKWEKNPFTESRAFQGLKVMMVLLNNWDIKDSNNKILFVRDAKRGNQLQYIISDLGATFGKTGSLPLFWRITRSRNNPEDYEKAKFIDGVKKEGYVDFHYGGKNRGLLDDITVAEAKWIGRLLSQLSDKQLRDAFRAANYNREEVEMLSEAVRERINDLVNLPG
ncbi:MAG TPA: hypothetical protein VF791_09120 [Pyrinomonadaceae bacterium]